MGLLARHCGLHTLAITIVAHTLPGVSAAPAASLRQFDAEHRPGISTELGVDSIPRVIREALSLYGSRRDSSQVAALLEEWDAIGGPVSARDWTAVAALWRRAQQTGLALQALEQSREKDEPAGSTRALRKLEQARTLFAIQGSRTFATSRAQPSATHQAADLFWEACGGADDSTFAGIWSDLRGLATDEERTNWAELPALLRCEWLRSFVVERAWRMAVTADERLAIHYRRLNHAREWYGLPRPRIQGGDIAAQLGRPPGLEIDDRGLVYLRLGPPDTNVSAIGPSIVQNETWAYYALEPALVYHFAPVSRMGGVQVADYRLLRNLSMAASGPNAAAQLYQSRQAIDATYSRYAFNMNPAVARPPSEQLRDQSLERLQNYRSGAFVYQGVPDLPELRRGIQLASEVLQFRNDGDSTLTIWFLAAARGGDLEPALNGNGNVYNIVARAVLATNGSVRAVTAEKQVSSPVALSDQDAVNVRLAVQLERGQYPYTLAVADANSVRERPTGNWLRDTLVLPEPIVGPPELSSIAVAPDSGGTWTRDERTFLAVSPLHVANANRELHVYFEIYGLPDGAEFEVDIRAVRDEDAETMYEARPEALPYRMTYRQTEGQGAVTTQYFRLDLDEAEPGRYVLGIQVTNSVSGAQSLPAVTAFSVR